MSKYGLVFRDPRSFAVELGNKYVPSIPDLPRLLGVLDEAGLAQNATPPADEPTVCPGCVKREAEIVALRACVARGMSMAATVDHAHSAGVKFLRALDRANATDVKGER